MKEKISPAPTDGFKRSRGKTDDPTAWFTAWYSGIGSTVVRYYEDEKTKVTVIGQFPEKFVLEKLRNNSSSKGRIIILLK
jgi:hypothetical protein